MMPDPLHPAVVHLPMALAVLVPILAGLCLAAIWRGLLPARAWAAIVLLQALLLGTAWVALETGEHEEERVERWVGEQHIEAHEEAAERFMLLAGLTLLPIGAGLLPGRRGFGARVAGTAAALAVLGAGAYVGHLGGELVYEHGAASAYTLDAGGAGSGVAGSPHRRAR